MSLSWLLSVIPDLKLHFSVIILSFPILSYILVSFLSSFVIKLTIKCNWDHPVYIKYDTETIQCILSMITF